MSYTDDYVRRYNEALDESRDAITADPSVENIDATFKRLFLPLIVEDISGAAHEPSPFDDIFKRRAAKTTVRRSSPPSADRPDEPQP